MTLHIESQTFGKLDSFDDVLAAIEVIDAPTPLRSIVWGLCTGYKKRPNATAAFNSIISVHSQYIPRLFEYDCDRPVRFFGRLQISDLIEKFLANACYQECSQLLEIAINERHMNYWKKYGYVLTWQSPRGTYLKEADPYLNFQTVLCALSSPHAEIRDETALYLNNFEDLDAAIGASNFEQFTTVLNQCLTNNSSYAIVELIYTLAIGNGCLEKNASYVNDPVWQAIFPERESNGTLESLLAAGITIGSKLDYQSQPSFRLAATQMLYNVVRGKYGDEAISYTRFKINRDGTKSPRVHFSSDEIFKAFDYLFGSFKDQEIENTPKPSQGNDT
jgi:hypothetical protein